MNTTINNLNINYISQGEGPDILFLHGWGSSHVMFTRIIKEFSGSFRCIAPDLPGCGDSDEPKEPFDIDQYSDFVLEFIKQQNIKNPILMGHSHGGRIIINLLGSGKLTAPKAVLFGSAGIKPKRSLQSKIRLYTFKTIKFILTLPVLNKFTKNVLENARNYFGSADYKSATPVMRQTLVNLVNMDLSDKLSNIKASTLLIWGENDTATPLSNGKVMEREIPDAGLCVIKNAGHFAMIEAPGQVNEILKVFLKGVEKK
ncbi:MAG: hypothetical protein BGN88_14360 [Clostridiales bacterium 43-6]|nr:MAG: hypothetical protein BGN88_14360 [Clostridiales bacterium 43-6]